MERITKTTWNISYDSTERELREGWDLVAKGEHLAGLTKQLRAVTFGAKYPGDFDADRVVDNKRLGLKDLDMDASLRVVMEMERTGHRFRFTPQYSR